MATRGRNTRRGTAPRRRLFWARRNFSTMFTATNRASTFDLLEPFQTAYGADLFGFTVTRIVGNLSFYAADTTATSTLFTMSAGIRVDDQAEITGSTEADQLARIPANDPHVDWMWVRNQAGATQSTTAPTGPDIPTMIALNRIELDLHSQRRMDELGQSLFLFYGLTAHPGADVTGIVDLHVLCKRP